MGMAPSGAGTGGRVLGRMGANLGADIKQGFGLAKDFYGLGAPKLVTTPGPGLTAPDETDAAVQAARSAEILRQRMSRGRSASFLTGPTGLAGPPPLATKSTLGT